MFKRILLLILTMLCVPTAYGQTNNQTLQSAKWVNLLSNYNAGFENGLQRWTATSSTFTQNTTAANVAFGASSGAWTPTSGASTLAGAQVAIPSALYGNPCIVEAWVKASDAVTTLNVVDGSAVVKASVAFANLSLFKRYEARFTCPVSGTLGIKLTASGAGSIVYLDQIFLGGAPGVGALRVDAAGSAFFQSFTSPSLAATLNYILPAADGTTAGDFMHTDASGTLSWSHDYQGGTASNSARLTVPSASQATITALTRRAATAIYNTTTNQLMTDDGTALSPVDSSEKSYIKYGASSANGWAVTSGVTIADDTTGSNMARPTTTKSSLLVSRSSGSTAFAYYDFTLDDADYNRKLKVQFDMKPNGSYAASDQEVDVYSCTIAWVAGVCSGTTARLALSTDSSSLSLLPVLTGTYRTSFDAPGSSAKFLQLQLGLHAATASSGVYYSDIIVGPGIAALGAAIDSWKTFTPTMSGTGTMTFTCTGYWRRVGDQLEEAFDCLGNSSASGAGGTSVTLSIPSGITINTALEPSNIGTASTYGVDSATTYGITSMSNASSTAVRFTKVASGGVYTTGDLNVARDMRFYGRFLAPINEWAGNGTINVASNDCEYAYNSSTATGTGDTTSFAYGPSGAAIQAISAALSRTVRFLTPISSTDRLSIEISEAGGVNKWVEPGTALSGTNIDRTRFDGTNEIGMSVATAGGVATDALARFGLYRSGTVSTWAGASTVLWRLKKCAGGQAVGFASANTTSAGLIDTQTQSFAGDKTFTGPVNVTNSNTPSFHVTQAGGSGQIQLERTSSATGSAWLGSANSDFRVGTSAGAVDIMDCTPACAFSTAAGASFGSSSTTAGSTILSASSNTNGGSGPTALQLTSGATSPGASDVITAINFSGTGASAGEYVRLQRAGTRIGGIDEASSTTVAYNTSSDGRLKDNVIPFPNGLATLRKIQPRQFNWKLDGHEDKGFIAQELKKVYPYAVSGNPEDSVTDKPMSVDYGKLTPVLAAAAKQIDANEVALEEKVAKMEAKLLKFERRIEQLEEEVEYLKAGNE